MEKGKPEFKIPDEVFFVTDEMNQPYLVVGIIDRGFCWKYLIGNKDGEKEVDGFEISKQKSYV